MSEGNKKQLNMTIAGAGGGGQKSPSEDRDSLQSNSFVGVVDLLGEGQIGGLVNKDKSILLNGTPIRAEAGEYNFKDITWAERTGTQNQEYISGFGNVETPYPIGTQLKQGTPASFQITNPRVDEVRVILAIGGLMHTENDGDIRGSSVTFDILMSVNGGTYVSVGRPSIIGKASSRYQRAYNVRLPKHTEDGTPITRWAFQVKRVTADSATQRDSNDTFIDSYTEIVTKKLTYPNSALMATRFNAETFSSMPKREYLVDGLLVRVPSNYDPETRTYNGVWDGTFKLAASSNPAWIMYDLLLADRYGLGEYIDATMVDEARLYQIGQYCDQLVDDGFGKKEPRYAINCVINSRAEAYDLIMDISSTFNGMAYWAGNQVGFMIDAPSDPVMAFTPANIIGEFGYSGTSIKDRHSIVAVTWNDPEDNYKQAVEYVEDPELVQLYGVRKLDIHAFGCTSRGQAHRQGRWMLYTEHQQAETVVFKAGLDAATLLPGDIIQIQDPDRSGKRFGGRLISCNARSATLDDAVDFGDFKGLKIALMLEDGGFVERPIKAHSQSNVRVGSTSTVRKLTTVTWDEALKVMPVSQGVWVISSPQLELVQARVVNIKQGEDASTAEITAVPHNPSKYLSIENGIMLEVPVTSVNSSRQQEAPKEVRINSEISTDQGIAKTRLVLEWDAAKGASQYEVEWKRNDGNWVRTPPTAGLSLEIDDAYQGIYTARVAASNIFGAKSYFTYSVSVDLLGKIGKPANVIGFSATGLLFGMQLSWAFASGKDNISHVSIEQSAKADRSDMSHVGDFAYPTSGHTMTGLMGDQKIDYRIKVVDKSGNESDWSEWASGTTSADPAAVLDIIGGHIGEGALDGILTGKIDAIDSAAKKGIEDAKKAADAAAKEAKDRAAALVAESKARADALVKEASDRAAAITTAVGAEASTRSAALAKEASDRTSAITTAVGAEASTRSAALAKEASDRAAALAKEASDRAAAVAKEVTDRNTAISTSVGKETTNRAAAIAAEAKARADALAAEATARTSAINTAVSKEVTDRTAAIAKEAADRKADLVAQEAALQAAASDLTSKIEQETAERQAVASNLTKEVADRAAAITAEAKARGDAISAETTARTSAITAAVSKEATDRGTAIAAETKARGDAIAAESTARAAAITKEVTDRTAAINKEVTDRKAAITKEVTDRNAAITAKATEINADVAAKVKTLNDGITQEVTDRKAGDTAVVGQLNAYKISNDQAVAAVLEKAETAISNDAATASKVTGLQSSLNTTNSNVAKKADATALAALDTKVTKQGDDLETKASQITQLTADIESINLRGQDLVSNGLGQLQSNKYWSGAEFTAADKPSGAGSFIAAARKANIVGDELIAVDPSRTYRLSYYLRQLVPGVTAHAYGMFVPYDVDKLAIAPAHYMAQTGTLTKLAKPLKKGDTTMTLEDASKWNKGDVANHLRSAIFWNYTDKTGYTWPANTYSRNTYSNFYEFGAIEGNVITLRNPWSGAEIPAGTEVSNGASGGSYMYIGLKGGAVPQDWTEYSGEVSGTHQSGIYSSATNKLPMMTAYVKVGFLTNRKPGEGGNNPESIMGFGGVSLRDWSVASDESLAKTAALNATNTEVGRINGVVTTHGTSIAKLQSDLSATDAKAGTGVANAATAQQTANTAVTATGANASRITELDSSFKSYKTANDAALVQTNSKVATVEKTSSDADKALGLRIDTVEATAKTDKTATTALVTAETTARTTADTALSGRIDSLTASTTTELGKTNAAVTAEQTARATADTALGERVDSVIATAKTDKANVTALVTAETKARTEADTAITTRVDALAASTTTDKSNLQASITAEQTARTEADTALGKRVDAVIATAKTDKADVTGLVSSETTARTNADNALGSRIDAVSASTNTELGKTNAAVSAEQTARSTADTALGKRIDAVVATAKTDKADVTALVTSETTARTTADAALSSRVDTLNTTVTNNNTAVTGSIADVAKSVTTLEGSTNTKFSSLESKLASTDKEVGTVKTAAAAAQSTADTAVANDQATAQRLDTLNASFQAISTAGQNLLKLSNSPMVRKPSGYHIGGYDIGEMAEVGKVYTLVACVTIERAETDVNCYLSGYQGSGSPIRFAEEVARASNKTLQVLKSTFTWTQTNEANRKKINFYWYPNSAAGTTGLGANSNVTIHWACLYEGTTLPVSGWQQSPFDVAGKFAETNAAIGTINQTLANADSALAARIDTLTANTNTEVGKANAAIKIEETARTSADTALGQRIDTLNASTTTELGKTNATVTAEQTARTTADTALGKRIDAVVATAKTDKSDLQSAITSEQTARTTADTALGSRIDTLTTTVSSNDTAVKGQIQDVAKSVTTLEGSTNTKFSSLESQLSNTNKEVGTVKTAAANAQTTADTAVTNAAAVAGRTSTLEGKMTAVEGNVSKKLDATAINNYYTKTQSDASATTIAAGEVSKYDASLVIGGTNLFSLKNLKVYAGGNLRNSIYKVDGNQIGITANNPNDRIGNAIAVSDTSLPIILQFKRVSGTTDNTLYYRCLDKDGVTVKAQATVGGTRTGDVVTVSIAASLIPSTTTVVNIGFGGSAAEYTVTDVMVVNATKITAWQPSSADTAALIDANSTAINTTNTEVTRVDGVVKAQGNSISKLQADLTTLDGKANTINQAAALAQQTANTAVTNDAATASSLSQLKSTYEAKTADLDKTIAANAAKATSDLSSAQTTLTNADKALGQRIDTVNTTMANDKTEVKGLITDVAKSVTTLEGSTNSKVSSLESQLSETNKQVDVAKSAAANAQSTADTAVSNAAAVASRTNTLEGKMTAVEGNVAKKLDASAINNYYTKSETTTEATRVAAGEVNAYKAALVVGGVNQLINSEAERGPTSREYLMYENSEHIFNFFEENLDKDVTISFDLKVDVAGLVQVYCSNGTHHIYSTTIRVETANVGKWVRYSVTVQPKKRASGSAATRSAVEFYGTYDSGRFPFVRKVQLEAGNVATAWSPSPRDYDKSFGNVQNALTANADAIKATDATVAQVDGKVTANASDISKLRSDLTAVDAKAGTAVANAATAQSTANTAVTGNAATASRVATLESEMDAVEADVKTRATAAALNSTNTEVSRVDGVTKSQGTAITKLTNDLATTTSNTDKVLDAVTVKDTRNDNELPIWYWRNHARRIVNEFKSASVMGVTGLGAYVNVETRVYYGDSTGGPILQVAHGVTNPLLQMVRRSSGSNAAAVWTAWEQPLKTMNDTINTKASTTALNALDSKVTQVDGKTVANASKIETIEANLEETDALLGTVKTAAATAQSTANSAVTGNASTANSLNQLKTAYEANAIDVNGKITAAGNKAASDLSTAQTSLSNADKALGSRIDSLTTTVSNNDTAVKGQIKTVSDSVTTLEGNTNNKITSLQSSLDTTNANVAKKFDAAAINNYYTKVDADKAIAGQVSDFKANLNVGGDNLAVGYEDGLAFTKSTYLGSSTSREVGALTQLEMGSSSAPFKLTSTGGTATLKTTPLMTVFPLAKVVLSFKAKNLSAKSVRVQLNGLNTPKIIKGETLLIPAKSGVIEFEVTGQLRPDYDWFQFQLVTETAADKVEVVLADIQLEVGNVATGWKVPTAKIINALDANAQAIQTTNTEVSRIDGQVKSQSSSLSELQSDLTTTDTKANTAITNAATAQSTANTGVTKADSAASSVNTLRTDYNAKVALLDAADKANAAEVVKTNTDLTNAQTALSNADKALGTRIDSLTTTVSNNDTAVKGQIKTVSDSVTTLTGTVNTKTDKLTADLATANTGITAAKKSAADAQTTANSAVTANSATASRVGTLESKMTTVEGGLAKKAEASALNNYYTKSQSEDKATEIAAGEVAKYDAGLVLGGQNLIPDSKNFRVGSAASTDLVRTILADGSLQVTNKGALGSSYLATFQSAKTTFADLVGTMRPGEQFTVTVWFKAVDPTNLPTANPTLYLSSNSLNYYALNGDRAALAKGKEVPFSYTRAWPEGAVTISPHFTFTSASVGGGLVVTKWQIERGTKSSDWSPSATEIQSSLDANASAINSTNAEVTRIDGQVRSQASSLSKLQSDLNTADAKAGTALSNAATAQTTANTGVTKADAVAARTSTLEGKMSTVEGNVAKKLDATAINNYYTKAQSDTSATTIAAGEVSKYDANLQIGGVNLIADSYTFNQSANNGAVYPISTQLVDGIYRFKRNASHPVKTMSNYTMKFVNLPIGTVVTYSVKVRPIGTDVKLHPYVTTGGISGDLTDKLCKADVWTTLTATFSISSSPQRVPAFLSNDFPTEVWVEHKEYQIELGTKATAWSPANEDIQGALDANSSAINSTNAEVTRVDGEVKAQGSSIAKLQSDLNTTDAKAGTAISNAATAQSTANTGVTKADAAASTVNTLKTQYEAKVADLAAADSANAAAITKTNTDLTSAQTALSNADKALGNRIDSLTTTVSNNDTAVKGEIKDVADSVTTLEGNTNTRFTQLESTLNTNIGKKADATALNAITTRVTNTEKENTSQASSLTSLNASLTKLDEFAQVMNSGKLINKDPVFKSGMGGVSVYNNARNDAVVIARREKSTDNPTTSTHELMVQTTGLASPNWGGMILSISSRPNAVFLTKYIAKLPVGYEFFPAANAIGSGGTDRLYGQTTGTGKFATFYRITRCGADGSFSTAGHLAVRGGTTPTVDEPLEWVLASIELYDCADFQEAPQSVLDSIASAQTTANSAVTEAQANASAITTLNTGMNSLKTEVSGSIRDVADSVTTLEGNTNTKFTELESSLSTVEGKANQGISAAAAAQSTANSGVTTAEAAASATNTLKATYEAKVAAMDKTIAANATKSASDLTSAQTTLANADKALGSRIDSLTTTVSNNDTAVKGQIQTVTNSVTTLEGNTNSKLTQLESSINTKLGGKADAAAFSNYYTKVEADKAIAGQLSVYKATVDGALGQKLNASVINDYSTTADMQSAIATASMTLRSEMDGSVKLNNLINFDALLAGYISGSGQISAAGGNVNDGLDAHDPNYYACLPGQQFATTLYTVGANVGSTGRIVWYNAAKTVIGAMDTHSRSKPGATTTVTAPAGAAFYRYCVISKQSDISMVTGKGAVEIRETTSAVSGTSAAKVVTVDNNGVMSGYGLMSEIANGQVTSAFGINADQFYIGAPSNGKKLFIVTTSNKTIDGVTYPAGTWIDTANIANATIEGAKIKDASITNAKIANATIEGAKIKDATITNAKIGNAQITGAKIADLEVDTVKIKNNAITVPAYYSDTSSESVTLAELGTWYTLSDMTVTDTVPGGNALVFFGPAARTPSSTDTSVGVRTRDNVTEGSNRVYEMAIFIDGQFHKLIKAQRMYDNSTFAMDNKLSMVQISTPLVSVKIEIKVRIVASFNRNYPPFTVKTGIVEYFSLVVKK